MACSARQWFAACVLLAWPAFVAAEPNSGGYRGPQGNGVFTDTGLLKEWPKDGPKLLWKQEVQMGYSAAAVVGDKVYVVGGKGGCSLYELTLADGKILQQIGVGHGGWKRFSGPRSVPVVHAGMAVTIMPNAEACGVDLATGKVVWKHNTWKDYGSGKGKMGWGSPESPTRVGDNVIFNTVSRDPETPPLVALNIKTGEKAWETRNEEGRKYSATDCSGAAFRHQGKWLVAYPMWRTFLCVDGTTGVRLWEIRDEAGSPKALTPVYNDGYLLAMPRGDHCQMLKLSDDGKSYTPLWKHPWRAGYSHAVILDKRVYFFGVLGDVPELVKQQEAAAAPAEAGKKRGRPNLGQPLFLCLDAETGKVLGSCPTSGPGHVAAADGMIYTLEKFVSTERKKALVRVRLIKPTPDGFKITGEFIPELSDKELGARDMDWQVNLNPVIYQGRLLVRYGPLMCFDIRAK